MRQRELSVGVRKRAERQRIHSRAIIPKIKVGFIRCAGYSVLKVSFSLTNQRWYRANSPSVGFADGGFYFCKKLSSL